MDTKAREQIGKGAQAVVYRDGEYAVKVFHEGVEKYIVFYEAMVNSVIELTGLPIAKYHEVLNLDGRMAVKMEYIKGKSLNDCIFAEPERMEEYIQMMVNLQIAVHETRAALPFTLKGRLRDRISGNDLIEESAKTKVLALLEKMPEGSALCHGDFHGYNIIVDSGRCTIIDWADVSIGFEDADVCRTYMLYYFYAKEAARMYLDIYCGSRNKGTDEVLRWLPVIGAARLSENNNQEKDIIMKWINGILR